MCCVGWVVSHRSRQQDPEVQLAQGFEKFNVFSRENPKSYLSMSFPFNPFDLHTNHSLIADTEQDRQECEERIKQFVTLLQEPPSESFEMWRERMYKRARLRGMDDEDDDDTMTEDSYTLAERQLMEELDEEIS